MTSTNTPSVDAEVHGVAALPGWRGTDPDDGTWVRIAWASTFDGGRIPAAYEWAQITADGTYHARSQEEAEAAGLVRLIPAVGYHYDEHGEDVVPDAVFGLTDAEVPTAADSFVRCTEEGPNGQCDQDAGLGHFCSRKGHPIDSVETSAGERYTPAIAPAAPVPLDPGNPEHLRQVAAFCRKTDVMPWDFYAEADRLDRERAEAEQDASDRKLARAVAQEGLPFGAASKGQIDLVLAGIRAERARKEAAK